MLMDKQSGSQELGNTDGRFATLRKVTLRQKGESDTQEFSCTKTWARLNNRTQPQICE